MDDRVQTRNDIILIQASPIMIVHGSMPTRIILYRDIDTQQYVTHKEFLCSQEPDEGSSCKFIHHGLQDGAYFPYKSAIRPTASMSELEARHYAEENYKVRCRDFFMSRI